MYLISKLAIMIFLILTILMILVNLVSKKTFYDREKNSPFECGFDPKTINRLPFSLHFFLIAIIFLIFDVEITLLIPFIYALKMTNLINYSLTLSFFMFILLLGIYHEWNQGALEWTK
uniref:NADH dehydrogenase subunit 3 n=1 Tax=Chaetocnema confinis TaxID=1896592 RepID=UPI0022373E4F|nr:NADH dehydrogenase subunit 3 [Chaetocnema confinis]UYC28913.1 NADH dehydrogenase subunit 3 [Chaetocnema confinis]